jgi:uncharacterized protein involved in oxidation of intracellular sulfur
VKTLVLLNDPAYGAERSYNGLRLAHSLAKRVGEERADLPARRRSHQRDRRPEDTRRLLQPRTHARGRNHRGAGVALCGSCMDARGIRDEQVIGGARRSNLEELTDWTLWADKVVTF